MPSPLIWCLLLCTVLSDTGNLTGKHLISNKDLFSHLDETAAGMPVKSASNDISKCAGEGSCTFVALDHTSPSFASSITLDECSYVPGFGVNLLSVQKLLEQGASWTLTRIRSHSRTVPRSPSTPTLRCISCQHRKGLTRRSCPAASTGRRASPILLATLRLLNRLRWTFGAIS